MENSRKFKTFQLFSRLMILFGFYLLGAFIGQFFGLFAVISLLKVNMEAFTSPVEAAEFLMNFISHPEGFNNGHKALLSLQWFSALGGFILPAIAYNRWIERGILQNHFLESANWQVYVWCFIIVIISNPVMEAISYWNANIHFPAAFQELENSMRATEESLTKMTLFFLEMNNLTEFLTVTLVVAVAAAVGEELFFRGIMQNLFLKYIGNPHISIWLTAFIFSYIHFQFLGFFPRLFLGAFLGYLYFWYKSLTIPIIYHFFNNFFIVAAAYFYQQNGLSLNELVETKLPELWTIPLSLGLVVFYVQRLRNNRVLL